jgi:hypothetical protein
MKHVVQLTVPSTMLTHTTRTDCHVHRISHTLVMTIFSNRATRGKKTKDLSISMPVVVQRKPLLQDVPSDTPPLMINPATTFFEVPSK